MSWRTGLFHYFLEKSIFIIFYYIFCKLGHKSPLKFIRNKRKIFPWKLLGEKLVLKLRINSEYKHFSNLFKFFCILLFYKFLMYSIVFIVVVFQLFNDLFLFRILLWVKLDQSYWFFMLVNLKIQQFWKNAQSTVFHMFCTQIREIVIFGADMCP